MPHTSFSNFDIDRIMNFDSEYFNLHFFVITKDNCCYIQPSFFGYSFFDDKFIIGDNKIFEDIIIPYDAYGAFINVFLNHNHLFIMQDYYGSFGLYLYKNNEYWAISNSFLLLSNFISKKFDIFPNFNFCKAFFITPNFAYSLKETPISNITQLPEYILVDIDLSNKSLSLIHLNNNKNNISLDSVQGISLIDRWHHKWNNLLHNLIEYNTVTADLSGGFGTRACLTSFFGNNVDLNKISFISPNSDFIPISEDFKFANEISKIYNFNLNTNNFINSYRLFIEEALLLALFIKCGFHKLIYDNIYFSTTPEFRFTGFGNDIYKSNHNYSISNYLDSIISSSPFIFDTVNYVSNFRSIFYNSIKDANHHYFNTQDIFNSITMRFHYCKDHALHYLFNRINCSPLLDPMLRSLIIPSESHDLFFALIIDRFCPELFKMDFALHHSISPKIWDYAKGLNTKYPYNRQEINPISIIFNKCTYPLKDNSQNSMTEVDYIKKVISDDNFKYRLSKLFSSEIYNKAIIYSDRNVHFPMLEINAIFQIDTIINLTNIWNSKLF